MNILGEKLKLFGPMFRCGGDGGDGGGGDSGGDSGDGDGDGEGDAGDTGDSGDASGPSGADTSASDAAVAADADAGIPSLSEVTVSAEAEPPNTDVNGNVSNSVLNNLLYKGAGIGLGQLSGLPPSIISNMLKGIDNPTEQNQSNIINSFFGVVPVVGQLNGLAAMMGLPTIGSAVTGLGGVPASSVAADTGGGSGMETSSSGLFGTTSEPYGTAASLGMGSGDPLLASLFHPQKTPTATNQFLKDIMKQENIYG